MSDLLLDCKIVRIFAYSSTRELSLFINCNFMLKLLQYCNYIIIVMQIKLMLLSSEDIVIQKTTVS